MWITISTQDRQMQEEGRKVSVPVLVHAVHAIYPPQMAIWAC